MQFSTANQESNGSQVAIGIVAWNEEAGIKPTLDSLLEQTLFAELEKRGWKCEILCLANGCTDRTVPVVEEIFAGYESKHPNRAAFRARVVELQKRGKINAWNQFVHELSPKNAKYMFLMDADILIHRRESLWNMLRALEEDHEAYIAVDRPKKHLLFKERKTPMDYLSLAASRLTSSADGQLCGQLYCIRAEIARNIYLPKDLSACEDGFIKTLVCTDFLTRPSAARRIRVAEGAEHTFEAYTSPKAIVKNQKRQIIGQTIIHILVDHYFKNRPSSGGARLADTLESNDRNDPLWLKRLIHQHLEETRHWWRLYPGMSGMGFRRLRRLNLGARVLCFPAAVASSVLAVVSGRMAHQALRAGCTEYWPQAQREGLTPANSKT